MTGTGSAAAHRFAPAESLARDPGFRHPTGDARYPAAIAGITAGAAVVRVMFLWRPPLWRDEAFTAMVVSGRTVPAMLDAVRHDSAPPLAYLLIHVVALFSTTAAALRLVSVLAGVLAVPIAAALGRRCGGTRAGLFAGAAVAVMPAFVTSSRDARMYALATTLIMLCVLLLWRAIAHPSSGRLAAYAAAVGLAIYTQYFAAFAIIAMVAAGIALLGPTRATVARIIGATAVGGGTLIPWLVAALPQFQHAEAPFWVKPVGLDTAGGVVTQFLSGTPVDAGTPQKLGLQTLQGFAIAGGLAAIVALSAASHRRPRLPVAFLAASGLGGIGLLGLISLWHPLLDGRYASVMWGPLAVLIGIGLAEVPSRTVAAAALLAMLLSSASLSVAHLHPDAPEAAAYLDSHVRDGDYVSASPEVYQLMEYYGAPRTQRSTHITAARVIWYWGTAAFPPGAVIGSVPPGVAAHRAAVFTVGNTGDVGPPLPVGYRRTSRQCWVGICIEAFAPTAR